MLRLRTNDARIRCVKLLVWIKQVTRLRFPSSPRYPLRKHSLPQNSANSKTTAGLLPQFLLNRLTYAKFSLIWFVSAKWDNFSNHSLPDRIHIPFQTYCTKVFTPQSLLSRYSSGERLVTRAQKPSTNLLTCSIHSPIHLWLIIIIIKDHDETRLYHHRHPCHHCTDHCKEYLPPMEGRDWSQSWPSELRSPSSNPGRW